MFSVLRNSGRGATKDSILKGLKKMVDLSNSNLLKNTDGLLATKPMVQDVLWVTDTGNEFQKIDFRCSINFLKFL